MKQAKKLTRALKIKMSDLGLQIDNWKLKEETNTYWVIINEKTMLEKKIWKD